MDDYRFRAVGIEEVGRVNAASVNAGFSTHADVVLPYFRDLCDEEQAARWLPGPLGRADRRHRNDRAGAGSDLRGIRTRAIRDGSDWILSGSKMFITNGTLSDLAVVVARTDPDPAASRSAFSLFVQ